MLPFYKIAHQARLLPNGRPGDQISEQVAQTGALIDSSSLSRKYDPSWN